MSKGRKVIARKSTGSHPKRGSFKPPKKKPKYNDAVKLRLQNALAKMKAAGGPSAKFKPGQRAIKEIGVYQKFAEATFIPKAPFKRIVKDILVENTPLGANPFRIKKEALEALQIAAEDHITQVFHRSQILAIWANRKGIKKRDVKCATMMMTTNFHYAGTDGGSTLNLDSFKNFPLTKKEAAEEKRKAAEAARKAAAEAARKAAEEA